MKVTLAVLLLLGAAPAFALQAIDDGSLGSEAAQVKDRFSGCLTKDGPAPQPDFGLKPKWLGEADIRHVFDSHGEALNALYQAALAKNPCLGGVMLLNVDVDGEGRVIAVRPTTSNPDLAILNADVMAAVQTFRFPATGKPDRFWSTVNFFPR